jgi:hypothetical protein
MLFLHMGATFQKTPTIEINGALDVTGQSQTNGQEKAPGEPSSDNQT